MGDWTCEQRETKLGRLRFRFRFCIDGQFEITGIGNDESAVAIYRPNGRYVVVGSQWTSSAINDGRLVELRRDGDDLIFVVDEKLEFRLRRA